MPDQFFYYYELPSTLEEIETGIKTLESEIINSLPKRRAVGRDGND